MIDQQEVVFLVDDDAGLLRALARLLRVAGYTVESYESPRAFLARERHEGPGCLIVDLQMPEMTGLEVQEALGAAADPMSVIFLSGQGTIPASVQAIKGGALDFLLKPVEQATLFEAVRGGLQRSRQAWTAQTERRTILNRFSRLTPRERQVCLMLPSGLLNKQIAWELGTSEQTIKVHRGRILHKMEVGSIAELVQVMQKAGLLAGSSTP